MLYISTWRRVCVGAKLVLSAAAVAGFMAASAPAEAITINGFGMAPNSTTLLSIGDVFGAEVRGSEADGAGSFFLGFTATTDLVTVETNTLNPLDGFVDPFIQWNTAANGSGTTLAFLDSATLTGGGLTTMVLNILAGDTRYLIVSWADIAENLSNWDVRVEAVPLPAGLLLFLSGLAGIGFLGRYKARRSEPAAA